MLSVRRQESESYKRWWHMVASEFVLVERVENTTSVDQDTMTVAEASILKHQSLTTQVKHCGKTYTLQLPATQDSSGK